MSQSVEQPAVRTAPRWLRLVRARQLELLAVVGAVVFLALAFSLRGAAGTPLDVWISDGVRSFNAPWFLAAMEGVSAFGYSPLSTIVVAVGVGAFAALRMWQSSALLALAGAHVLVVNAVKAWVLRPRPSLADELSFPSGHVAFYASFFGFLFFLIYTQFPRSRWRTLGLWVLGALIVLVSISRIVLGAHWFSDTIGGYAFGLVWVAGLIQLFRMTSPKTKQPSG